MALRNRSANVFNLLQQIAHDYPDLRPGQVLQAIGIHVPSGVDPFYWEAEEWIRRIYLAFPEMKERY